ncbi:5-formyltetrahydrofolate cyclo-ligase-like [Zootermopsis nevadensis]|uniref:5-formyltetrahydrofolate cyclo-ligase n=1 Tax=Zootermopsis nevadensis TaxID=136037 RepID=A0A067R7X9_ZOONE|nr:5-formyltetrahydrofolate cyclo-ligase-like [Zootermopsis nevadensis]KDR19647.1 5-formyltetrahydrofolate cyclo-ligase [Zootermopsis nevadensis]
MSVTKEAKLILRKDIKKIIALITPEQKKYQSDLVTERFLARPEYHKSRRISVFISMDDEIQTDKIIQNIFLSGKSCFIPRYADDSRAMDMVRLNSIQDLDSLPTTKWSIRQPAESEERENALETGGLDLILVPGLAFTVAGHRLGRGRGYYDTFLAKCRTTQGSAPLTVGLAFSQQMVASVPTDENDICLDKVLHG